MTLVTERNVKALQIDMVANCDRVIAQGVFIKNLKTASANAGSLQELRGQIDSLLAQLNIRMQDIQEYQLVSHKVLDLSTFTGEEG